MTRLDRRDLHQYSGSETDCRPIEKLRSIFDQLHFCPLQPFQRLGDLGTSATTTATSESGWICRRATALAAFEVDLREPLREGGVMIDGQVVDEEAGVTVDQSGGGLELPGLAFDQGPAGVVELGLLGGRPPTKASSSWWMSSRASASLSDWSEVVIENGPRPRRQSKWLRTP